MKRYSASFSYWGNANQNHNKEPLHITNTAFNRKTANDKCWQERRELEPTSIADGNIKWYSRFEEQFVNSSKG